MNWVKASVLACIILCGHFAHANVAITEIMYDLDGGDIDWVEVYNPDSSDVDLTGLKLLVSNSTSNHGITKVSGSAVLHSGDYGVIVGSSVLSNFTAKWGNAGNVFSSSFSLSNDTGKVEINKDDKLSPLSSVTYTSTQGAAGDGKSLQKVSDAWQAATPTPGAANTSGSNQNADTSSGTNSDSNTNTTNATTDTNTNSNTTATSSTASGGSSGGYGLPTKQQNIRTKISLSGNTFTNTAVAFNASTTGRIGEAMTYGKYFWNFGDGDSKVVRVQTNNETSHTYFYPGEYTVTLEYFTNFYSEVPDATDRILVKVIDAGVVISRVGEGNDFFIEITNNSDYSADMSRWALVSRERSFVFPKDTLIPSKKKTIISGKITGFTGEDRNELKLLNAEGQVIYAYPASVAATPVAPVSPHTKSLSVAMHNTVLASEAKDETVYDAEHTPDLSAAALNSGEAPTRSYAYLLPMMLLVVFGGYGAYRIRKRGDTPHAESEDFELIDE